MQKLALSELHAQLKSQKSVKGEIARQFKNVAKGSDEHQQLLMQMQKISAEINETETVIKTISKNAASIESTAGPNNIAFDYLQPELIFDGTFKITLAKDTTDWKLFLGQNTHTPYHQPAWQDLIKNEFGHETIVLIAHDSLRNILGAMPLTIFSSKLFGRFAVSIPFINYGGAITQYKNISQTLVQECKYLLAKFNLSHIEVRSIQPDLYPVFTDKKASMILRLPESDEILDKSLGAKLRSQYKKADDYSPKLSIGKTDLLDDFYQVFARNMRDLGTPVYPKHFFRAILENEHIGATILCVSVSRKPVSAAFLIANNNILEIPWASTITEANKQNMNMWMYRQILSFAIENKFEFFDFGRSTIDAGTYKFKKQWGAIPTQHYWYYIMPEGQALPEINPNNPKYKLFISLWKLMPVWLTKIIGPLLIKHIP